MALPHKDGMTMNEFLSNGQANGGVDSRSKANGGKYLGADVANGGKNLETLNGQLSNSDQLSTSGKEKYVDGTDSEHTYLINRRGLSPKSAVRFHTAALIVSWISVVFSLGTGVTAIVLSVRGKSESLFAYGLDAILDSLSSIAVVWRFFSDDLFSQTREQRACIVIGCLFLVSSVSLIGKSVHSIITETHETKNIILYEWFASTCAGISIILATTKVYLGYKLSSRALATDSIITYVGAVTCIAGVTGLELYNKDSHLWYLDSVFGIVCGVFLFFFGVRLLYTCYFCKNEDKIHDIS